MNRRVLIVIMAVVLLVLTACDVWLTGEKERQEGLVRLIGPDGRVVWSFTEDSLPLTLRNAGLSPIMSKPFTNVYSTVNNWPTQRFYVAEGYRVESILIAAGLYDKAQTVTFRSGDGYEITLTMEQLSARQFYYPLAGESDQGAEEVFPVIAYRWREGTDDLSMIHDSTPTLIIGQRNTYEQTNPAYVVRIFDIIVSDKQNETWSGATTFPSAGRIAPGEKVKLQHPNLGKVKLHYTLDGSEPTLLSPMYNLSNYQPELNVPIAITEPTVIKVLASGYGKLDSNVTVFEFFPDS